MSEKIIFYCDACGEKLPEHYDPIKYRLHITVGLVSDPAGGASTSDQSRVDICHSCMSKAINVFLNQKCTFEYNQKVIDSIHHRVFTLAIPNYNVNENSQAD